MPSLCYVKMCSMKNDQTSPTLLLRGSTIPGEPKNGWFVFHPTSANIFSKSVFGGESLSDLPSALSTMLPTVVFLSVIGGTGMFGGPCRFGGL